MDKTSLEQAFDILVILSKAEESKALLQELTTAYDANARRQAEVEAQLAELALKEADLRTREDALLEGQQGLVRSQAEHDADRAILARQAADYEAGAKVYAAKTTEWERSVAARDKQFQDKVADVERRHLATATTLAKRENAVAEREAELANRHETLTKGENDLRDRMAKLKEIAA